MTPDKTPTPTDAEAWAMWTSLPLTGSAIQSQGEFARAVLAKWGSPVVAGEPVAWCQQDDSNSSEAFSWPGTDRKADHTTPLYLAPQPTQAQAGAVPLTPEQAQELIELESWGPDAIGLNAQFLRTIRRTEAAHGIKEGGQHAAD